MLQHNQRLIALGGLAPGLAHELNNPAADGRRSVTQLSIHSRVEIFSTRANGQRGITPAQWSYITRLRDNVQNPDPSSASRRTLNIPSSSTDTDTDDPIKQSEIEEEIIKWLGTHGVNNGWKITSDLFTAGITINDLNGDRQNYQFNSIAKRA